MGQAGATEEEIEQHHARLVREAADQASFPGRLEAHTHDVLLGGEPESIADLEQALWRLRPDEVAAAMRIALESEVLVLPVTGTRPQRAFKPYPGPTDQSMGEGRDFELAAVQRRVPWGRPTTPHLTVGNLGIAVTRPDGRRMMAIRWDQCVAVVHEDRYARTVLGRDGYRVAVNAAEWHDGGVAVKLIDKFAPSSVVIPPG